MSAIPKGVALFLYRKPFLKNIIRKAAPGVQAAMRPLIIPYTQLTKGEQDDYLAFLYFVFIRRMKMERRMPSTYAHFKLGRDVKNRLIGAQRVIVDSQNDLYMIGLHGPDILFYHRPLVSDPVNAVGYSLHEKSGRSFFEQARDAVIVSENQAATLAYAYGVLCHFALDASCHAYVDEKIESSGVPHTEIEVEFDRMLMLETTLTP